MTFEDNYEIVAKEISKRRAKWNLSALSWMDFDDVSQIIKIHIHKKWDQYDPLKSPLIHWLNRIISNQMKNLLRNNYGNFTRPCLRCPAAQSEDLCAIYGTQCSTCPLYAHWERTKQPAYQTKLPVPIENHWSEVSSKAEDSIDIEKAAVNLAIHMEKVLKPLEWKLYKMLYVDNLSDEEAAELMGYKTSEAGRAPGYKQIKNLKKIIIKKVRKVMASDDVDIM